MAYDIKTIKSAKRQTTKRALEIMSKVVHKDDE